MSNAPKIGLFFGLLLTLVSCGTYFNQPMDDAPARMGETTKSTNLLTDLPQAAQPVEVAVYNFSDQTGQYKAVETGSTFSTAVTQGATTILIKALEDSGWFIPIERENLQNLSTERNIIRNTKQEYIKNLNPNEPPLPPLLYAGLLLEGGIVSYDTNIVTGGIGARYFGIGASARYRQDRITIYLRAVSTSNAQILKTVYVSKTILSQALDASFFRFVKFQRLLEAETGITQNEPVQIAVQDAVEKAVHDLIMEGIIDQYWGTADGPEVDQKLVEEYLKEKEENESIELYNRVVKQRDHKNVFSFAGGVALIDADYSVQNAGWLGRLEYRRRFIPQLGMGLSLSGLELNSGDQFTGTFGEVNLNAHFDILPYDDIGPYIYAGGGMLFNFDNNLVNDTNYDDLYFKMQMGVGVRFDLSDKWGIKIFGENNIVFSDKLDNLVNGKRNDWYWNMGVGFDYYFGFGQNRKTAPIETSN